MPDFRNLALIVNQIEHRDGPVLDGYVKQFFLRFERLSTQISGGTVQFFMHEKRIRDADPADAFVRRHSAFHRPAGDATVAHTPAGVCIEKPELGLYPDALPLIGELLVGASNRMQLIVTTHSDALVSPMSGHLESVLAFERLGGATAVRHLEEKKLTRWLGDLWRMGKLGGNP